MTFDPGGWSAGGSGEFSGHGPRSYLFSPATYRNFILQTEARLNAKGDSDIVLCSALETGIAEKVRGATVQHRRQRAKTGSLYNYQKVAKTTVADNRKVPPHKKIRKNWTRPVACWVVIGQLPGP